MPRKASSTRNRFSAQFDADENLANTGTGKAIVRLRRLQRQQRIKGEKVTGKKLKRG